MSAACPHNNDFSQKEITDYFSRFPSVAVIFFKFYRGNFEKTDMFYNEMISFLFLIVYNT